MRIFVIGVPHTKTLSPLRPGSHTTCAFTMKVWHLCKMMYDRGHEVIHLGVPGSEPICTKHIDVVPIELWDKLYGSRPETDYYITKEDGEYAPYMEEFEKNTQGARPRKWPTPPRIWVVRLSSTPQFALMRGEITLTPSIVPLLAIPKRSLKS